MNKIILFDFNSYIGFSSLEVISFGLLGFFFSLLLLTLITSLAIVKDFSKNLSSPLGLLKYNGLALFISLLIYLICIFFIDNSLVFAAEDKVNLNVNTSAQIGKVEVSFLSDIFTNIGNAAAYTAGLNIGYKLLKTSPMPPIGKGIVSLAAGGVSFITFHALTTITKTRQEINVQLGNKVFKSKSEAEKSINADTAPDLGQVEVSQSKLDAVQKQIDKNDLNFDVSNESSHFIKSPLEPGDLNNSTANSIKEKVQDWFEELFSFQNMPNNGTDGARNVIDTNTQIASSLDIQTIIELLTDSFILNILLIFLILMLTWILTVKIISEKDLNWIKNKPLGHYTYSIFNFLFKLWKSTNTLWIYFILFFILMGCVTNLIITHFLLFVFKS